MEKGNKGKGFSPGKRSYSGNMGRRKEQQKYAVGHHPTRQEQVRSTPLSTQAWDTEKFSANMFLNQGRGFVSSLGERLKIKITTVQGMHTRVYHG